MTKEKPLQTSLETSSLETLELKANLNPEQREYLDVLKDRMEKILGNKTKQELAKRGDLVSLKNYRDVLLEILRFLQTKDIEQDKYMGAQLELIDKKLKDFEADKNTPRDYKELIGEELDKLKKIIKNEQEINEVIIENIKSSDKEVYTIEDIRGIISSIIKIPGFYFILTEKHTDKSGKIFYLEFSRIDSPNKKYNFLLSAHGKVLLNRPVTRIVESLEFQEYSSPRQQWNIAEKQPFGDRWYRVDYDSYGEKHLRPFDEKI